MIPDAMLQEMKGFYSIFISENIKEESKREYYFKLVNSIPDNLFGTKNPIRLRAKGMKLSGFLFSMNKELREDGCDLAKLEQSIKEMNERYKKAITRGMI